MTVGSGEASCSHGGGGAGGSRNGGYGGVGSDKW